MLRRLQHRAAPSCLIVAHLHVRDVRGVSSMHRTPVAATAGERKPRGMVTAPLLVSRRSLLEKVFGRSKRSVKVDDTFDKEQLHYSGTIFGLPADDVIFYTKVLIASACALVIVYIFLKGYMVLSRFSIQTVARLGFFGGFGVCVIGYSVTLALIKRASINANAVYNQSIALVMRNEKVKQFLGSHPRTGEFRSYSATGGFKFPLMRRIRSGSYEISDLLGLKPRRLQMLFTLQNADTAHEGLITCDVRKESTGFLSSTNVYKSLSITLTDGKKSEPETIYIIGQPDKTVHTFRKP